MCICLFVAAMILNSHNGHVFLNAACQESSRRQHRIGKKDFSITSFVTAKATRRNGTMSRKIQSVPVSLGMVTIGHGKAKLFAWKRNCGFVAAVAAANAETKNRRLAQAPLQRHACCV